MYVCMYVCVCMYMCVSMHAWIYVICRYICTYVVRCTQNCACVCMCICRQTNISMYTCMHIKSLLICHCTHIYHMSLNKHACQITSMIHTVRMLHRHITPTFLHKHAKTQTAAISASYAITCICLQ